MCTDHGSNSKVKFSNWPAGTPAIPTLIKSREEKSNLTNYGNEFIKGRKIFQERKAAVTAGVSNIRKLRDQVLAGTFQMSPEL